MTSLARWISSATVSLMSNANNAIRTVTSRFIDTVIDGARARIAAGWQVEAVRPDGIIVTQVRFGRVCRTFVATQAPR